MLLSPEDFCLVSEKESRLLFVEPASARLSAEKLNSTGPGDDAKKRRIAGESVDDVAGALYAKTLIG